MKDLSSKFEENSFVRKRVTFFIKPQKVVGLLQDILHFFPTPNVINNTVGASNSFVRFHTKNPPYELRLSWVHVLGSSDALQ